MSEIDDIAEAISPSQFKSIERTFRRHFGLGVEVARVDGSSISEMCSGDFRPEFCSIINSTDSGAHRCCQVRRRSLKIAFETGQPYSCLCHAGIVLVCVPVMQKDAALGGIFFGKCLWENADKTITDDMFKRLQGLEFDENKIVEAAKRLPVVAARKIHEAAEFLFILLYETSELDPRVIHWRKQRSQQQSEISDIIQQSKDLDLTKRYPYEMERELIAKVKIGDRTGAREILNTFLGTIMFHHPGDVMVLKARLVELLGVLSRAAVEGGVDIDLMLEKNLTYINAVMSIDKQEDICVWISSALNDFIESVYSSNSSWKVQRLKPVVDFIEAHFDKPLTLTDMAKIAHLSVSRFAHLFKEQMNITPIEFLCKVRIEYAKERLLSTNDNCTSISFDCGYNNQSYFNRIFKEQAGMTPRQFRQRNRRLT